MTDRLEQERTGTLSHQMADFGDTAIMHSRVPFLGIQEDMHRGRHNTIQALYAVGRYLLLPL